MQTFVLGRLRDPREGERHPEEASRLHQGQGEDRAHAEEGGRGKEIAGSGHQGAQVTSHRRAGAGV